MQKIFTQIVALFIFVTAFAQQEAIVPLIFHPKKNEYNNQQFKLQKSKQRISALSLPFFDDFNQNAIYPNVSLWQDNFVYINNTFPKETITLGVATFDGTDANGKPYSNAATLVSGAADKLTSNAIDLSGMTADSNVFLSFYYLQGDFGETPTAPNDLLTLQFLDTAGNWNLMWQTSALSVAKMRQVFVKVDSIYLNAAFQFRFESYGNLNGANDTWHIDYVKLDRNRDTSTENTIKEMAYEFAPKSLLKHYYAMPYHQFDTLDLADTVSIFVKNNFVNPTTDIVDYYDATVVNTGTNIASFNGPSRDFGPLSENEIKYPKFLIPTNIVGDTVVIKVDYHFDVSAEAGESAPVLSNNSMSHQQVFSNFFSYDDGSAERGYWVESLDYYKMAVKYHFRNPDTIQAIKFQVLPTQVDNNLATFSVCVWKNFNRNSVYAESDLLYKQTNLKLSNLNKEFSVDTINNFYYVPIKPDFVLNGATYPLVLSDTFAIGLIVDNKQSLTIGFDRNNNRSAFNFYVDGVEKWRESGLEGTMIINPVVGKPLPYYLTPIKQQVVKAYDIKLYPNPANTTLFIEGIKDENKIEIFALDGRLVQSNVLQNAGFIFIQELPAAPYFIKITNTQTNQTGTAKFIKSE